MEKFSLNEIIELAIQIEQQGYKFYDQALNRKDISDMIKEQLIYLRSEEVGHEAYFKKLRDESDLEEIQDSMDWALVADYLKVISSMHIFNDEGAAIKLATEAKDERTLIEYAIRFEKDTLLFFYAIERKVDDTKAKEIVSKIIQEEVSHVMKLNKILNTL